MDIPTKDHLEFYYERVDEPAACPSISMHYVEIDGLLFVGKELRLDNALFRYYFFPGGEDKGLLMIFLSEDEPFNSFVKYTDEDDTLFDRCAKVWPMLCNAFLNADDEQYIHPSIVKIDGIGWLLVQQIADINIFDLDTEEIINKANCLIDYAIDMSAEMDDNILPPATTTSLSFSFKTPLS